MNKIFALILVFAVSLSLTACSTTQPPVSTEPNVETLAPTVDTQDNVSNSPEETTPPTSPTVIVSYAEEMLKSEDTVEISFNSAEEYAATIQDLGYNEILFNYFAYPGAELAIRPLKLTYNDTVFRLEFSYMDITFASNGTPVWTDNWVLYGTTADSNDNIAGFNFDDYQYADLMPGTPPRVPQATLNLDIFPQMDTWLCTTFENDEVMTDYAYFASYFYPSTGKLYNFVHTPENANDGSFNVPRILKWWDETLVEAWKEQGLPTFSFYEADIDGYDTFEPVHTGYHYYCFEPGMTLVDWAKSPYNMDGWSYKESEKILVSWDGDYVAIIGYDKNGNQYTIDDHFYGLSYTVPVMKKEVYEQWVQNKQ